MLALGGVGVLIYFIHHIATSIQASTIVSAIAQETITALDRMFPADQDRSVDEDEDDEVVQRSIEDLQWSTVPAAADGYIQDVDFDAVVRLAEAEQTVVRMERGAGDFVVKGSALVSLGQESPATAGTTAALNGCFSISRYRTVEQDPGFGIRQIVDIGLKALSPGSNDTSTAVICIDYLTAILARLAGREFPRQRRYTGGELRVVGSAPSFTAFLGEALSEIRRSAAGNVSIIMSLLDCIEVTGARASSGSRVKALRQHVHDIADLADRSIESRHDRAGIERVLNRTRDALAERAAALTAPEGKRPAAEPLRG